MERTTGVETTRLRHYIAAIGLLVLFFLGAGSRDADASATFSPAGPPSPAVDMPGSVSFNSNGEYLAVAGSSGPLSRYAINPGGVLEALAPSGACAGSSASFKPTGSVLASADAQASTVALCTVSRTGSVTPLGSPLPTGETPTSIQFSPDGKFLATNNIGEWSISMFTVGATTLAPVNDGEGFDADGPITSMSFSPDSRFLVVSSGCDIRPSLTVFAIAADGSLKDVDVFDLSGIPEALCVGDVKFIGTSNEFFANVETWNSGNKKGELRTFSLSPTGEVAEAAGTLPTGRPPAVDFAVSPDGRLVACINRSVDTLTLLQRDSSGTLHVVMSVSPGDLPSSVAFSPDGTHLGVTTANDDAVELYRLAPGPAILPAGTPEPVNGRTTFIATSPTGAVAAATQGEDGVRLYTLSAAGRLTQTGGLGPAEVNTPHGLAFSSNGNLLAVANENGLSTYTVSAEGVPAYADFGATEGTPLRVAISPDGSLAATANYYDSSVSLFSLAPDGTLTARESTFTGEHPRSLAFSPDGALLVTVNEGSGDGNLSVFGVSGTTLTHKPPIPTGGYPVALAFRPTGGQLAVVSAVTQNLTTYAINADGAATTVESKQLKSPFAVAYSPSGDFLAVVSGDREGGEPGELRTFSVSEEGATELFGDPTVTAVNPFGVAFDASREFILIPDLKGYIWVYPLAAPTLDTVIKTGPAANDSQASPQFDFDASYPSSYECRLDNGSFAPCKRSPALEVGADGNHTLAVRARDAVGNVDSTPASYSWTRDTTAPSTPAPNSPLNGATNLAITTSFSWKASTDALSGVSGYELMVDGMLRSTVQPSTCGTTCGAEVSGLANGPHTWSVYASDVAGNTSQSPVSTFSVDAEAPGKPSLLSPSDGAVVGSTQPTLSWLAAVDGGSGVDHYELSVDGNDLSFTTATIMPVPTPLADGSHAWSLVAIDRAGNRSAPASAIFKTDTTAPIAHLAAGPKQTLPGVTVVLDAHESTDSSSAIADFSWDTNGDGTLDRDTGRDSSTTTTFAAVGTYHLTVRVTDEAGLTSSALVDVTITPTIAGVLGQGAGVRFIPPKATGSRVIKLVLTPPAGARAARISNDDDPNQAGIKHVVFDNQATATTSWVLDPQTSPGKETKQVFVWFERGTELVHTSPTIILDELAPDISTATFSRSRTRAGKRMTVVRVKADDHRGTGIKKVRIGPRCSGPFEPINTKPRNGAYTIRVSPSKSKSEVRVTVRDAVGNPSRCVTARKLSGGFNRRSRRQHT